MMSPDWSSEGCLHLSLPNLLFENILSLLSSVYHSISSPTGHLLPVVWLSFPLFLTSDGSGVWIEYMCQCMWVLGGRCEFSIFVSVCGCWAVFVDWVYVLVYVGIGRQVWIEYTCQCMWMLGGRCGLSICVSICGCWAAGVDWVYVSVYVGVGQ